MQRFKALLPLIGSILLIGGPVILIAMHQIPREYVIFSILGGFCACLSTMALPWANGASKLSDLN